MEEKENIKDVIAKIKADLAAKVNELEANKTSNKHLINKIEQPKITEEKVEKIENTDDFINEIKEDDILDDNSITTDNSKPIKRKKINFLPILLILLSLIALAYTLKMRNSIQKEKNDLEELKKQDVDYKKKIIFTDIEDDVLDQDLQKINDFKDIPEDSIQ
ncbi:MAG: hypothetical protein V3U80_08280 [Flavobacteriaceae bacterium]